MPDVPTLPASYVEVLLAVDSDPPYFTAQAIARRVWPHAANRTGLATRALARLRELDLIAPGIIGVPVELTDAGEGFVDTYRRDHAPR